MVNARQPDPLLAASITCFVVSSLWGQANSGASKVSVDDLGRSVTLVGRLGVPLGVTMEIRGRWSMPAKTVKDYSPRFTVTNVDGRELRRPVEFNIDQITVGTPDHKDALPDWRRWNKLDGREWSLVAYETGYIEMSPDEYGEKQPVFPIVAGPYYAEPFTSKIIAAMHTNHGRTRP